VATVYVDTSALGRALLDEPDRDAIAEALSRFDSRVSSQLLRVELRRLARRHGLDDDATALLANMTLLPLDDTTLAAAETAPPAGVATLDAIHLVTALRLANDGALDALMTFDARLAAGAEQHGIPVIAPRR
jgi:predicted nucleic acid-binding protein